MEYTHALPHLRSIEDIPGMSKILLRMDLDVPMESGCVKDVDRLIKTIPTIQRLLEKDCVVVIIGHLGRPQGVDSRYSLKPVFSRLVELLKETSEKKITNTFIEDFENDEVLDGALEKNTLLCLENLRFFKGEEENDPAFLSNVVKKIDWFVNDAFAVSHRKHRSILLYKTVQTAYGISFITEVTKIMKVIQNPDHPITILLGGSKEDKLSYLHDLEKIADHILIGGKLPLFITNEMNIKTNDMYCIATLNKEQLDLNADDVQAFTNIISKSKTIVWIGAMGLFENPAYQHGTEEIARAVVASDAYTILAGGDTERSVSNLNEEKHIDLIASGGGVMLELLTKRTLPAWE